MFYKRFSFILIGMLIFSWMMHITFTWAASWLGDVMPVITDTYVLGNETFRWLNITTKYLHASDIQAGNLTTEEDITGGGDLNITGNGTLGGLTINLG